MGGSGASRRGLTAAAHKIGSLAAFPSLGMAGGSGALFPANSGLTAGSLAAPSPRLGHNTSAAAFPAIDRPVTSGSPLGMTPGTPRGTTASWSEQVSSFGAAYDRPVTAGSPLGMTSGMPKG